MSGIAAYRSALTLDWLAAEDSRQRELAAAFETEAAPPARVLTTECIAYPRPSTGKVARLMLELLKNLEGDDAKLVPELVSVLVRSKLLVETSILEAEPDLDMLVKTPGVMMGEPHVTFPRILAMLWMTVSDPTTTKKMGWCPINKVNKYITISKSMNIAKHMRSLDPIIARARFIIEEFIQNVTPLNMYQKKAPDDHESQESKPSPEVPKSKPSRKSKALKVKSVKRYYSTEYSLPKSRVPHEERLQQKEQMQQEELVQIEGETASITSEPDFQTLGTMPDGQELAARSAAPTHVDNLIGTFVVLYSFY